MRRSMVKKDIFSKKNINFIIRIKTFFLWIASNLICPMNFLVYRFKIFHHFGAFCVCHSPNLIIFICLVLRSTTGTLAGSGLCPTRSWNIVLACQHELDIVEILRYWPVFALCICPETNMSGTISITNGSVCVSGR